MKRKSFDQLLDGKHLRRLKAEDRLLARQERREAAAAKHIGELTRDGRTVFYVWPAGGRYRESASFTELVGYLHRNGYIR